MRTFLGLILPMIGSIRGIGGEDECIKTLEQHFPGTLALARELDLVVGPAFIPTALVNWLNTPLDFDVHGPRFLRIVAQSKVIFAILDPVREVFSLWIFINASFFSNSLLQTLHRHSLFTLIPYVRNSTSARKNSQWKMAPPRSNCPSGMPSSTHRVEATFITSRFCAIQWVTMPKCGNGCSNGHTTKSLKINIMTEQSKWYGLLSQHLGMIMYFFINLDQF